MNLCVCGLIRMPVPFIQSELAHTYTSVEKYMLHYKIQRLFSFGVSVD